MEMIEALYKPSPEGMVDDGIIRDGVSESQFSQVLNIELEQIIKAYQLLGDSDVPKFTLIHRLSPQIVHPRNYDFYMCAHAGMIGTSRPAHCHVLLDEIGFSPNDLQNLIHALSYVYQRITTAISIETSSGNVTSAGSIIVPDLPRLKKNVAVSMFFC
ncbi:hypothetical protein F3Y22_tig00020837pilonHSYRG00009 [Hibiscus syriacus]|uniref:Piwi domain-containing protein n=1 Tax=Hibiscus syriacus TaxID=106335 RepID=A0A6A3BZB5_HIBSY|nr:hypothetical protein F3Y22_tig00020837pilonHSYRG00009 [Hibiscus syriacus]